jgi:hypothetical protein
MILMYDNKLANEIKFSMKKQQKTHQESIHSHETIKFYDRFRNRKKNEMFSSVHYNHVKIQIFVNFELRFLFLRNLNFKQTT